MAKKKEEEQVEEEKEEVEEEEDEAPPTREEIRREVRRAVQAERPSKPDPEEVDLDDAPDAWELEERVAKLEDRRKAKAKATGWVEWVPLAVVALVALTLYLADLVKAGKVVLPWKRAK